MEMKQSTFLLMNVILVLILVLGVAVVGWIVVGTDVNLNDADKRANLQRLVSSADLYYSRLNFYGGVCSDIGVLEGYGCSESEVAYAVETRLDSGWYYCGDSTGFIGDLPYSLNGSTVCKR